MKSRKFLSKSPSQEAEPGRRVDPGKKEITMCEKHGAADTLAPGLCISCGPFMPSFAIALYELAYDRSAEILLALGLAHIAAHFIVWAIAGFPVVR